MNKTVRMVLLGLLLLIAGFDLGLLLGPSLAPARPVKKSSVTTLPSGILLNIPDVRQSTTYSCGAAALQAVLNYYGIDKRERALMEGTRGVIPKQEFLDRWHDYTGEPPFDSTDRAYVRLGIFITGKTSVRQFAYTKVD